MMFWNGGGLTGWGWATMTVGMVVFWGLLIGSIVLMARGLNRPADQVGGLRPSPEQLLAERFARGEIDEDEYRRRSATLSGSARVGPTA